MKKILITIIVGTIMLFFWNAVSWMGLPFHTNTLTNIPESVIQQDQMKRSMPESGVYHYPGLPIDSSPESMAKVEKQLAEGPRITMMVYKNEPTDFFNPMTMVWSLLLNLLTVSLTYFLISQLKIDQLESIIVATLAIGAISTLVSDLSQMNWYLFPLDYTLVNLVDKVVSFGLLGLLFGLYTFRK